MASYRKYTDREFQYMKEHCHDRPEEVAAILNAPLRTVNEYMRQFRNGKRLERKSCTPQRYYALYNHKTDELVCTGTAKECAAALGISRSTFYSMVCKAQKGIVKKWDAYVEDYEDLEIE